MIILQKHLFTIELESGFQVLEAENDVWFQEEGACSVADETLHDKQSLNRNKKDLSEICSVIKPSCRLQLACMLYACRVQMLCMYKMSLPKCQRPFTTAGSIQEIIQLSPCQAYVRNPATEVLSSRHHFFLIVRFNRWKVCRITSIILILIFDLLQIWL